MSDHEAERIALQHQRLKLVMSWVVVVVLATFGSFLLFGATQFHQTEGTFWKQIVEQQFPVVVALPMAGLGAMFIVLVLRMASGPIDAEIGPLKFTGAAAPIVFWLICFVAIALMVDLLWQPGGLTVVPD